MKKYFYISSILLFIFACKNEPKEIIIDAEPSANGRVAPHQSASEQFNLDKGTKITILGVSSHKDKIAIGGKEYNEPWYLVENIGVGLSGTRQGWVYGGCISFPKNYVKPSFSAINEKDLIGKSVDIAPCFEGFDKKGQPSCGTDCGFGSIQFLNEKEFLSINYCMGGGVDYNLGTYSIGKNQLTLTFSKPFYNIPEEEETDEDGKKQEPQMIIKNKKAILDFEIHHFKNKPVFTPSGENMEDFLGNPYPSNALTKEEVAIIEDLKQENIKWNDKDEK
jgi:hypothetical protein